jgi:DNA-binding IclR family transcriptional regulator
MDKERYVTKAILQAGMILKAVANSREPMTISEISAACEISKDVAFRTCVTLEDMIYLQKVGDRYDLGMGLALFWAKKKATLEAQRDRIDKAIETLGI